MQQIKVLPGLGVRWLLNASPANELGGPWRLCHLGCCSSGHRGTPRRSHRTTALATSDQQRRGRGPLASPLQLRWLATERYGLRAAGRARGLSWSATVGPLKREHLPEEDTSSAACVSTPAPPATRCGPPARPSRPLSLHRLIKKMGSEGPASQGWCEDRIRRRAQTASYTLVH